MGRSGQPVQNPGGRIGNRFASACTSLDGARLRLERGAPGGAPLEQRGRVAAQERLDAALQDLSGVLSRARQHLLAHHPGIKIGLPQDHVEVLLDELRLPFLDDQHGALARAKAGDFLVRAADR